MTKKNSPKQSKNNNQPVKRGSSDTDGLILDVIKLLDENLDRKSAEADELLRSLELVPEHKKQRQFIFIGSRAGELAEQAGVSKELYLLQNFSTAMGKLGYIEHLMECIKNQQIAAATNEAWAQYEKPITEAKGASGLADFMKKYQEKISNPGDSPGNLR